METQTEQESNDAQELNYFYGATENKKEQNGLFVQSQGDLSEEVNLRLFNKPKADRIKANMSEFVKGLK